MALGSIAQTFPAPLYTAVTANTADATLRTPATFWTANASAIAAAAAGAFADDSISIANINGLQAALDAKALTVDLNSEATRAINAENDLTTSISVVSGGLSSETSRATAAESGLESEISGLTTSISTNTTAIATNATAISAETSRATAAEATKLALSAVDNDTTLTSNSTVNPPTVHAVKTALTAKADASALTTEISDRTAADALLVPKATTVNSKALSGPITLTASDVGAAAADLSNVEAQIALAEYPLGTIYKGVWDPTTDTPTIPAAAGGNDKWSYFVNADGAATGNAAGTYVYGDRIVSDGTTWLRQPATPAVIYDNTITFAKLSHTAIKSIAGNKYLRAFVDRLIALGSDVDWDRFDVDSHARVIDAIGDSMPACSVLALDRGCFKLQTAPDLLDKWYSADPAGNDLTRTDTSGAFLHDWGRYQPQLVTDGVSTNPVSYFTFGGALNDTSKNKFMLFWVVNNHLTETVTFANATAMHADTSYPPFTVARTTDNGKYYYQLYPIGNDGWQTVDPYFLYGQGATSGARHEFGIRNLDDNSQYFHNEGQLHTFFYDGSTSFLDSRNNNLYPNLFSDAFHLISLSFDGTYAKVYCDGKLISADCVPAFSSALAINSLAGLNLGKGTFSTLKAVVGVKDFTPDLFRRVHDSLAGVYGLPRMHKPRKLLPVFIGGQSNADGSCMDDSSSGWTTTVGWGGGSTGGSIGGSAGDGVGLANDNPTVGTWAPVGWLGIESATAPVGAIRQVLYGNGNTDVPRPKLGSDREGCVNGFLRQLYETDPDYDVVISNWSAGGASIDQLSVGAPITAPPTTYKVNAGTTSYLYAIGQMARVKDYANRYDYQIDQPVLIWRHGETDNVNTNYATKFLALYDYLNADTKKALGTSKDLIALIDQPQKSEDGTVNNMFIENCQIIDILNTRGARPIFGVGPGYPVTNFIHQYSRGHRWTGEMEGKAFKQIYQGTGVWEPVRPKSYTLGSNYVDITFYMEAPPLQFATNNNNVDALLTNKGFEYSGGGLTITSVALQSSTVVRINLSGTPAAGHTITYVENNRFGNLCDSDASPMYFKDQDWTTGVWPTPVSADGLPNDPRNWCMAFKLTL